jgi:hypothetical protein
MSSAIMLPLLLLLINQQSNSVWISVGLMIGFIIVGLIILFTYLWDKIVQYHGRYWIPRPVHTHPSSLSEATIIFNSLCKIIADDGLYSAPAILRVSPQFSVNELLRINGFNVSVSEMLAKTFPCLLIKVENGVKHPTIQAVSGS